MTDIVVDETNKIVTTPAYMSATRIAEVWQGVSKAVNKTLAMPSTRERFTSVGADVLGGTPAQLDSNLKQELAMWTRVARAANIRLD